MKVLRSGTEAEKLAYRQALDDIREMRHAEGCHCTWRIFDDGRRAEAANGCTLIAHRALIGVDYIVEVKDK